MMKNRSEKIGFDNGQSIEDEKGDISSGIKQGGLSVLHIGVSICRIEIEGLRVGSKITQVSLVCVKETRCLGILAVKCPVFLGLLRTDYAKLFLYDP